MKIAIATDHAGLASDGMYESIKQYLTELGHDVADYGPGSLDMEDDYPEFM
ncbi:RpiB/LacA/LacB family sugar-phosphate isomerase, partial [Candidatus Saccharibacteria bacterium]|nr:RpiB/LacA/LacB family sugar-phosphate isomerase [Candidatus Saccharibacteria bacterium]